MKNLFFTAILLLVLGTAFTLYLEYKDRQFIEHLPKPPIPVTQSVQPPDASVPLEIHDSDVLPPSTPPVANTITIPDPSRVQKAPHIDSTAPTETSETPLEPLIFEENTEGIAEGGTEADLLEKQPLPQTENGHPWFVNFQDHANLIYSVGGGRLEIYGVLGEKAAKAFLESTSTQPPLSKGQISPKGDRNFRALWNQVPSVIEVNGMEIHLPRFEELELGHSP